MVNDTSTLNGSLQECIDRLETNLQAMGVSDAEFDSSTGILGLIDEIPNISPSVGGIELDTNITLDESNLETEVIDGVKVYKVYNNRRTTINAYINALYDDTTVDMKGVLQGATVSYDLSQIGGEDSTGISDNDGNFSMVINPTSLQDDMHYNVYMSFDGTGTDYKSCDELFRFMVRHDYVISFSQSEYTALNGECTIECTLTEDGVGLSGAIVTLSDGTSFYSNITNSLGVAEFNLTGLSATATWTCTYQNVSDTCNVVVMNYLIYDDASVDNSSTLFGSYISLRNNGTNSVSYTSSTPCYVLKNTRGSSESFRPYSALDGYTGSFKLTVRSKCTSSSPCPISLYYYLDSNNWGGVKDEHTNIWVSSKTNGRFTESNKGGTNHLSSELTDEFIYNSTSNTLTINRYYNGVIESTQVMNIPVTITSSVKWGTTLSWDNNATCEVYEIIAEPI